MVIIKIEKKPRAKNIYYVFFDNGERVEIFDEYVLSRHLKVNGEITENELKGITSLSQEKIGQQVCMQVLSRSMKTKKELVQKLKDKGIVDYNTINRILDKIASYGYIDDEKYAQSYISIEKNRKGKNKIKFELEQKGVAHNIINEYIEGIDDQEEVALSIANKYMKNKECSYKNKSKLYSHLVSKGFDFDVITSVLQSYSWQNDNRED